MFVPVQYQRPAESGPGRERQHVRTPRGAAELLPEPDGSFMFMVLDRVQTVPVDVSGSSSSSEIRLLLPSGSTQQPPSGVGPQTGSRGGFQEEEESVFVRPLPVLLLIGEEDEPAGRRRGPGHPAAAAAARRLAGGR